jgi:hypothetical protein
LEAAFERDLRSVQEEFKGAFEENFKGIRTTFGGVRGCFEVALGGRFGKVFGKHLEKHSEGV